MRFKWLLAICLTFCFYFIGTKVTHKSRNKFSIAAIGSNRPYHPEFETRPLSEIEQKKVDLALLQTYRYFGWGGQAHVFFSEDRKYVIKFFKQRLFRPNALLNKLPLPKILHPYRLKKNWKRQDKFARDFFSYKVSFDELQEETSLLYCHLNKTSHLTRELKLIDPTGTTHLIDMNQFDFILQRRAERVCERINRLAQEENLEETKKLFTQVHSLTKSYIEKGFYNRDPFIPNNCGLLDDRAIQIDVGRFIRNDSMDKTEELSHIMAAFGDWIATNFPQFTPLYQEVLDK